MPASCAASSASAICRAIGTASSIGIGPRAMTLGEVLALDQLHDEEGDSSAVILSEPHIRAASRRISRDRLETVQVGDVGVVEARQHPRLALEPRHSLCILGECLRQHLQRHLTAELGVGRPPHLAHAAGAEMRQDLVRTQARACRELHWMFSAT